MACRQLLHCRSRIIGIAMIIYADQIDFLAQKSALFIQYIPGQLYTLFRRTAVRLARSGEGEIGANQHFLALNGLWGLFAAS